MVDRREAEITKRLTRNVEREMQPGIGLPRLLFCFAFILYEPEALELLFIIYEPEALELLYILYEPEASATDK